MASPITGGMATGSQIMANVVLLVGEGPINIFPEEQLTMMTSSLRMDYLLCLCQNATKSLRPVSEVLVPPLVQGNGYGVKNPKSYSQVRVKVCLDSEEIRTLALKEQWISNPSP